MGIISDPGSFAVQFGDHMRPWDHLLTPTDPLLTIHKISNGKTPNSEVLGLRIGLVTVFGAILKGRKSGQKLRCLYGNPMTITFSKIEFYAIYESER